MAKNYARVVDGIVVETFQTDEPIETLFPPGYFVPCVPSVQQGWVDTGGKFAAPPAPPPEPRIVPAAEFVAMFTPPEVGALMAADPRLTAGALKAAAQGHVNMDSPELAGLLALAVEKNALTAARAKQVAAGKPAPAGG